jgi:quinol monooxygenase YgiN
LIQPKEPVPDFLSTPSKIREEVSITGKWIPKDKGGLLRKSKDAVNMIKELEHIHNHAKETTGILSSQINLAVGEEATLVHHTFQDEPSLIEFFSTIVDSHFEALSTVAMPDMHFVRGVKISSDTKEAIMKKNMPGVFGEYLFGYVKEDYIRPNQETAIQVTAKWTCKPEEINHLEELKYWWQRVGTDAFTMEKGLLRFEVFEVVGENALIIHETFKNSKELQFHLSKGTAEKYKKDIDKIAYSENYFFRGPVSWMIRTYSKFLKLPATYSNLASNFTRFGGSMSDGRI